MTPATLLVSTLGRSQTFDAVARDPAGHTVEGVRWVSSSPAVMQIDSATGVAHGVSDGAATITASSGVVHGTAQVIVSQVAAGLAFTATPPAEVAGRAFTVVVAARDSGASVVAQWHDSVTIAFGANPAGGVLEGHARVIAQAGLATFDDLVIKKAGGGYTLVGRTTTLPSGTTASFTVSPGSAAHVAFTVPPSDTVDGGDVMGPPAGLQVVAQDSFGNASAGSVTMTLGRDESLEGAILYGTVTKVFQNDTARFFDLRLDRPGSGYTLRATTASVSDTTRAFTVALRFGSVETGYNHTCGTTDGPHAYCWGSDTSAQLGKASGASLRDSEPALASPAHGYSQVTGGLRHTCGLSSGYVYCWGASDSGQVGGGTRGVTSAPVRADTSSIAYDQVAAGYYHSCGVTSAYRIRCWGANEFGQLGNGTTRSSTMPVQETDTNAFGMVGAGGIHTCGVTLTGPYPGAPGDVYCWGDNSNGQLGIDTLAGSMVPMKVPLPAGLHWIWVGTGESHSCAVAQSGEAYCWGANESGELGDGTTMARRSPVQVLGGLSVINISAGAHFTCAFTTAWQAYCWGDNSAGQLGDSSNRSSSVPVPVVGGHPSDQVWAGGAHACGHERGTKAVWCWGANSSGQLGDGGTVPRSYPVRVLH